jgi:hypothetical protein
MITTSKKIIKFQDNYLYIRIGTKEEKLGTITTRHGQLTRVQKLKAVASAGQWIEV